jgi:hypothetical protein
MRDSGEPQRRRGHYLGTENDETWWKRYKKDGFFARGNGVYWLDAEAFCFLRHLTKHPIKIPVNKISRLDMENPMRGACCSGSGS